jgi:ribonuclease-3
MASQEPKKAGSRTRKPTTPASPEQFAKHLGIELHRPDLLRQALTHKSAQQEIGLPSNERLEFLGDAVLGLTVAAHLYRAHPDLAEGELTKLKAVAVSESVLAKVASELDLGRYLILSRGEEQSGGRKRVSILADGLEAVFAAVYLDRGMAIARRLILGLLEERLHQIERAEHELDHKTLLQEKIQELHRTPPTYRLVDQSGPDHDRTFVAEVRVAGQVLGRGVGKSKKAAEQAAARQALLEQ